jgi:putative transcriptional regulator
MTAEKIQRIRRALGLNATDFGARLGVSGRTIEDWEQGRHSPRGAALLLLAELAKRSAAKTRR